LGHPGGVVYPDNDIGTKNPKKNQHYGSGKNHFYTKHKNVYIFKDVEFE
jgi:hypothetical protein